MYYIGIDGSSSFSRLVAVDINNTVIGKHVGGGTNILTSSHSAVKENLRKIILEFNKLTNTTLQDCSGLCIGSSAIITREQKEIMENLLVEIGFHFPVKAVHYSEIVLASQTKGEPGIAVISGSTSIGIAVDHKGNMIKCGGAGSFVDDGGSTYYIGIKALKHALMAEDGRCQKTILTEKIKEHFKIKTIDELIHFINSEKFKPMSVMELAVLVKYAAIHKDAVAIEIEEMAAYELFLIAKALINRSKMYASKVIISGSVLTLNENIKEHFTKLLKNEFKEIIVEVSKEKPEMGAVYLAKQL